MWHPTHSVWLEETLLSLAVHHLEYWSCHSRAWSLGESAQWQSQCLERAEKDQYPNLFHCRSVCGSFQNYKRITRTV